MIHVNRGPGPPILIDKDGAGRRELAKALAFFSKKRRSAKNPKKQRGGSKPKALQPRRSFSSDDFKAYKDDSVKAALETLFYGKCAYCENRYAGVHPVDVEHWRPKAGVIIASDGLAKKPPKHPGYYWLAAEWTNLLPSCIDCNRGRNLLELPSGVKRKLGKANQFPLSDESKRAYRLEDMGGEEPLLLNPCDDLPEQYLEFDEHCVIRPKQDGDRRAEVSISIYALNRIGLVEDRRLEMANLIMHQSDVQKLAGMLDRDPTGSGSADQQTMLIGKIKALIEATAPKKKFSLMARQAIVPFLDSLTGGLAGAALQAQNWVAKSQEFHAP